VQLRARRSRICPEFSQYSLLSVPHSLPLLVCLVVISNKVQQAVHHQAVQLFLNGLLVGLCLGDDTRVRDHDVTQMHGDRKGGSEFVLIILRAEGQNVGFSVLASVFEVQPSDLVVVSDEQSYGNGFRYPFLTESLQDYLI
jgi:hypothetical protein